MPGFPHNPTRRAALRSLVGGSLLLPGILSRAARGRATRRRPADPLAPKPPHFPPKAKRVIFLFSTGGVSHMDTFDPKPQALRGRRQDARRRRRAVAVEERRSLKPRWEFKPGGKCGTHGQRPVPAPPRPDGRHLPDPLDDDRQQRALPGDAGDPHRLVLLRPAEPRLVGQLRPGHGEPEPAVVRRPRPAPALRRHAGVRQRLPARPTTRARASSPARSRSRTSKRQAADGRRCRSWNSACAGRAQPRPPDAARPRLRPGRPHPLVRDRVPHAVRGARRRSTCRRRPTRRSRSTA